MRDDDSYRHAMRSSPSGTFNIIIGFILFGIHGLSTCSDASCIDISATERMVNVNGDDRYIDILFYNYIA
jgi:hypothetical protein